MLNTSDSMAQILSSLYNHMKDNANEVELNITLLVALLVFMIQNKCVSNV